MDGCTWRAEGRPDSTGDGARGVREGNHGPDAPTHSGHADPSGQPSLLKRFSRVPHLRFRPSSLSWHRHPGIAAALQPVGLPPDGCGPDSLL